MPPFPTFNLMSDLMSNPLISIQHHRIPVQMSCRNPLDSGRGRGPSRRAAHVAPDRGDFMRAWSLLMIGSFTSREACALHFGVTFQTACNWFDGRHRPYGDAVAHAALSLPRFAEVIGQA